MRPTKAQQDMARLVLLGEFSPHDVPTVQLLTNYEDALVRAGKFGAQAAHAVREGWPDVAYLNARWAAEHGAEALACRESILIKLGIVRRNRRAA